MLDQTEKMRLYHSSNVHADVLETREEQVFEKKKRQERLELERQQLQLRM